MSKPKIFISSTYFDLIQVRKDLNEYFQYLGYDVVLHENGDIPYGVDNALEQYAYNEAEKCDFLIGIIGSRFGHTDSNVSNNSITQREITSALRNNVKTFIFIQTNVYAEYKTYLKNKNKDNVEYSHVDDVRIFRFIENLEKEKKNNFIAPFKDVEDIKKLTSSQLSGLYKKLLESNRRRSSIQGPKITLFRDRNQMIDYFVTMMQEAEKGDVIWAQGVGHTAYTDDFQNTLTNLTNDGIDVHFIVNRSSPNYDVFTSQLKKIPLLKWVSIKDSRVRVFGLSGKCVIISVPSPEQYEAVLIKDPYFTQILYNWFNKQFEKLYKHENKRISQGGNVTM